MIVGYCFGIRSERRLCEEVHLNLAYRWFCRLGLDGDVPDHSTFSKNRHGRFREIDLLRKLFETVVAPCMKEGIVGGDTERGLVLEALRGLEQTRHPSRLRTTGTLGGLVTVLKGRTRSGFSSVTVKKNRSAAMAALIVRGLDCCCAICS